MTVTRRGAAEAMSTGSPDVSEEESTTAVPAKHKASSMATKGTQGASSQGKATSSSASKSKKALTVSPEQYAEFLKFQKAQQKGGAKQKTSEKVKKAQEDLAIQARNKALRDKEDSGNEEDNKDDDGTPALKRTRQLLSDDEASFAQELANANNAVPGIPEFANAGGEDTDEDAEEEDAAKVQDNTDNEEEDQPEEMAAEAEGPSEETVACTGNITPGALDDNRMDNNEANANKVTKAMSKKGSSKKSKGQEHSAGSSSVSSALSKVQASASSKPSSSASTTGNGKVTREHFMSSEVHMLADLAKSYLYTQVCFGNWVLDSDTNKMDWLWTVIGETPTALGPASQATANAGLQAMAKDNDIKGKLLTYVSYGQTILFNSIIMKAHQKVAGYFNLSCGSSDDIKEKVTWLLTTSNFLYGDLDVKVKTLNSSKPFGNAFIKDLIQVIWFNMTKGGSKAEAMTRKHMLQQKEVPITIVILVIVAIEHSIGEYCGGSGFIYHFKTWKGLVKKSKKWTDMYASTIFKIILQSCSDLSHLLEDEDEVNEEEIKDVNTTDLDNIADNGMDIF
ncbi:hypothetical protein CPB84DRAFT_1851787 [Gymnopilus junonius]|uniref:DUF6532 domain-containing protein n=1 Tax=Gymnopilus junonius TaxID=109634 RepID=A0A9P5NBR8_GYMJU|nr:hypothetical protein CPB84DRAFT_1851787 [Gymnopilus junonius]